MSLGFTLGISLSRKKRPSEAAARADSYPIRAGGLRLAPASRVGECLVPATEQLLPLGLLHTGLVPRGLAPHLADLLRGPHAGGDPGEVGRSQTRRLGDLRNDHRNAEDVGLELHQPSV